MLAYNEEILDSFDGCDEGLVEGAGNATGDEAFGYLEVLLFVGGCHGSINDFIIQFYRYLIGRNDGWIWRITGEMG